MKIFSSKKGTWIEEEFQPIFALMLLGGIVFLTLLGWILVFAPEKAIYEKNFLARDLSLAVDSLQAAPGNVRISYANTGQFSFLFTENRVQVLDERRSLEPPPIKRGTYRYNPDLNLNFNLPDILRPEGIPIKDEKEPEPLTLILVKAGNEIKVGNASLKYNLEKPTARGISTRKEQAHIVLLAEDIVVDTPNIRIIKAGLGKHRTYDFERSEVQISDYEEQLSSLFKTLGYSIDLVVIFKLNPELDNQVIASYYDTLESETLAKTLKFVSLIDAPKTLKPSGDNTLNKPHPIVKLEYNLKDISVIINAINQYFET